MAKTNQIIVSWFYTDTENGFYEKVLATKAEERKLRKYLEAQEKEGEIVDLYVGEDQGNATPFKKFKKDYLTGGTRLFPTKFPRKVA